MAVKTDLEISSVKYKDKYGHTTEIPVKSGGGEDMLQARVDATNSCEYLFYNYTGDTLDFINKLDTSNVTTMKYMFGTCRNVLSFDFLKYLNTSKVTDMSYMFSTITGGAIIEIPENFNTSNVTNMSSMFTFYSGTNVIFPENFNTSNVTNMSSMFKQSSSLTSLDLSSFDTSNLKTVSSMFEYCSGLTSLDISNFDNSAITQVSSMFSQCSSLENVNLGEFINSGLISQVTDMFNGCTALKTIDGYINLIKMGASSSQRNLFNRCSSLQRFTLKNIKQNLTIGSGTSYGTLLTLDTLINTIKELWDYSSGTTTYTLTMSTPSKTALEDVYVKLVEPTAEQIEADPNIVNKMPCEVCESTDEGAMLITDYATLKKWTIAS